MEIKYCASCASMTYHNEVARQCMKCNSTTNENESMCDLIFQTSFEGMSLMIKDFTEYDKYKKNIEPDVNHHIYFIYDGQYVKIGYAENITDRIKCLQTSSARKLELVASMTGKIKEEQLLHKKFKNSHFRGEWFYYSNDIKEFIDNLLKNGRDFT